MAKRTTAEDAATLGLEALLGAFDLLQQKEPPPSGITLKSWRRDNKDMAQRIALGVDHIQDALWKNGLDCRCTAPPGLTPRERRGLDWICTCEPRGQSKKRRKLTASMMGRKSR